MAEMGFRRHETAVFAAAEKPHGVIGNRHRVALPSGPRQRRVEALAIKVVDNEPEGGAKSKTVAAPKAECQSKVDSAKDAGEATPDGPAERPFSTSEPKDRGRKKPPT